MELMPADPPPLPEPESVWDSERLAEVPYQILRGHQGAVSAGHFCCDDMKILTSSHDNTAKLWDVATRSAVCDFSNEHTAPISECHPTLDSRRMVTSSYDKTVRMWDMETGRALWSVSLESPVTSCHVSRDGKLVVAAVDVDNAVCLIDSATAYRVVNIKGHHASTVTRCCFDAEDQRVCSVSSDRSVKMWDLIAQRPTVRINGAHSNVISDCGFSSSGRLLCTASWDKSLKLWDIYTGEYRRRGGEPLLYGHSGSVSSCTFSKDGSLLVSGGYDKTIVVWDVMSACKKLVLKGHADWVMDVALSSNKKWILSTSKDSTLRLWKIDQCEGIPAVLENKKAIGPRVAQCDECRRPFPIMHWEDTNVTNRCVFCRLSAPPRGMLHLPAVPSSPVE